MTIRQLPHIVKQYELDIIETTSYFALAYIYLFRFRKIPVLVRVSTTFLQIMKDHYPFKSRLLEWFGCFEIKMIRRSRHLITHTASHAQEMERLYKIPVGNFNIIPHGINLPSYAVPAGVPDNNITVLYVGRFEYRKGIDVLLAAIPDLVKQIPNIIFELVGADAENKYVNDFKTAYPSKIIDRVRFHGVLSAKEIEQVYTACDFLVAPSRYESFGLIYIEAMSYGKPVIGCKIGGASEIIRDQYNGLLAEVDNVKELAEKISYLATNKAIRGAMGANGLATVQQYFSAQTLVANSLNYYSTVLGVNAH